mmetsp:Transcript_8882/g.13740  ORF Transcript_8882/g.13740 Transcript_8882/m.13740 type:complete len:98 (+) Transcript_8882:68-361(+)
MLGYLPSFLVNFLCAWTELLFSFVLSTKFDTLPICFFKTSTDASTASDINFLVDLFSSVVVTLRKPNTLTSIYLRRIAHRRGTRGHIQFWSPRSVYL